MRGPEPIDKLLIAVLIPIWLACLGLHLKEIARTGFAEPPIYAAASQDDTGYPRVGGYRLERGRGGDDLQVGDVLIKVGETDLAGTGYFGFDAITLDEAGLSLVTPLVLERDGVRRTIDFRMLQAGFAWYRVVPVAAWVIISTLILLRGTRRKESRLFFAATLCVAIQTTQFYGGDRLQSYVALGTFWIFGGISFILVLHWALGFPYEVADRHRLPKWLGWIGAFFWIVRLGYVFDTPIPSENVPLLVISFDGVFIAMMLFIVTRNYFYSDPIGRRRVKWVLLSGYLGVAPLIPAVATQVFFPDLIDFDKLFEYSVTAWVLVPIGMLVGIMRYNLYDVDRLISVTASYSVVGGALLAMALTLLPRVAAAASPTLGIEPGTGQTALSFMLAMFVIPAHRKMRPQIERFFFRDRHQIEQGIAALLTELSECPGPAELIRRMGERLDALLNPEATIVYSTSGANGGYEAAFTRGRAVPPAFDVDSALVSTLRGRRGALATEAVVENTSNVASSPFDRAALETLGVPLVVPIHREDQLAAFLCLGPKTSGDVYTSTDITLLLAVSDKVSSELLRFDQAALLREGREMQASLRRYVPGAVAEQIEAGSDLRTGEQEVTVLFVDIRSYTTFSEGRRAEEVFSTVNRFTDLVSRVVRKHGGCVVEFNGDGMMTVFGAPAMLDDKERHAIEAGEEIHNGISELSDAPNAAPLAVGVGIATGEAFVGNIHAVDRLIWSAIGNTTNLAARLQQLTRDLDASIVIDDTTYWAARLNNPRWKHFPATVIRGRSEPVDLYALDLSD